MIARLAVVGVLVLLLAGGLAAAALIAVSRRRAERLDLALRRARSAPPAPRSGA